MALVFVVVELTTGVAQAIRLVVAVGLEDVAWFEENLCGHNDVGKSDDQRFTDVQ